MRLKHFLSVFLTLLTLSVGQMWGADVVVTLDNIGANLTTTANTTAATTAITATGTTDSYTLNYYQCKKQGNSMFMTKSVSPYISNKTAMPGNIKSVEVFINSGASGKTNYDCAFSTTECTSATSGIGDVNITGGNSHTFSNLNQGVINVKGKYFCVTLGNANNGQVLKLVITCEGSTNSDPVAVTGVTLDESTITLDPGDTQLLTATVAPNDASNKTVSWTSSNTSVATVDAGLVTAVAAGEATITATTQDGSFTDECTVTVADVTKSSLIFTAACGGSGTADDDAEWEVTSDGTESSFLDDGIHYGTSGASVTYVQLSTSDIKGTITKVVVRARDTQAEATVSVSVGGTAFTCSGSTTATNTSANYTFTGSGSGEIIVRVDRGSSMTKAIYVKSVIVTYESCNELASINGSVSRTNPTTSVLSWDANANVSVWEVKYRTHGDGDWTPFNGDINTNGNRKSATITTVCDTKYDFEIITKTVTDGYCTVDTVLNNNGNGFDAGKYSITINDMTGGSVTPSVSSACSGTNNVTLTISPNTGYQLSELTVASSDVTESVYNNAYTFSMPASDVAVSATFAAQHHNVVFHKNDGGEDVTSNQDFTYGVPQNLKTIETIKWSRDGFIFGGWMTTAGGSSADKLDGAEYTLNSESDVDLFALWVEDNTRTISYDGETHIASYSSKPTTVNIEDDDEFSVSFTLDDHYSLNGVAVTMGNEDLDESLISFDQESLTVTAPQGGFTDNISVTYSIAPTNYTVKFYINNDTDPKSTQSGVYGAELTVPSGNVLSIDDCSGASLSFVGWTDEPIGNTPAASKPNIVEVGSTIPGNKNYYAVFAAGDAASSIWEKATTVAAGDYLIASEGTVSSVAFQVAFDGSLTTLDAVGNKQDVTISGGELTLENADNYVFTFAAAEGNNNYTIQSHSGYYIGQTSDANGMQASTETSYVNNVTLDEDGNAIIVSSSAHLCYNGASDQRRFRYYKSSSYSGQKAIQLYKKTIIPDTYYGWVTVCPHCNTVTLAKAYGSNPAHGSITLKQEETEVSAPVETCEGSVTINVTETHDTGYQLLAINLDGVDNATYSANNHTITIPQDGDGTLTATATFTQVNYTVTMAQTGDADATLSENQSDKHYGDEISISTTTPEGYTFLGWSADPSVTYVENYNASMTSTKFNMPAANVIMTANFQLIPANPATVTFNAGAGTLVCNDCTNGTLTEENAGDGITLPSCLGNEGWGFLGWTATADKTTVDAGAYAGDVYHPEDDMQLYAVYTQLTAVTLKKGNGTTTDEVLYADVTTGKVTLPSRSSKNQNYTFAGWSTKHYSTEQEDANPSILAAGEYTPGNVITLYPVFSVQVPVTVWTKKTVAQVDGAGTYAIIDGDGYAFNGTTSSGHGQGTASAFSFTDNVASEAPTGTCELTFTAVEGGYTLYNADKGYLYATKASSGGLSWHQVEESYWKIHTDDNWLYNSNSAYLRTYVSGTDHTFRTYSGSGNGSTLYFAKKESQNVTKYNAAPANDVAAPTFSPEAGAYYGAQNVEISCETNDVTIYYTDDETTPTDQSTAYSTAISVSNSKTIKAIAIDGDGYSSTVAEAAYTINPIYNSIAAYQAASAQEAATARVLIDKNNADAIVIGVVGAYSYIQDGTAAMVIKRPNNSEPWTVGSELNGYVQGTRSTYYGLPMITVEDNAGVETSTGSLPDVQPISNLDFASAWSSYAGNLIKVENVYFQAQATSGDKVDLQDGAEHSGKLYDAIHFLGSAALPLTETACDITGILVAKTENEVTTHYIAPTALKDISTKGAVAQLNVNPIGGADAEHAAGIAPGGQVTVTPVEGFATTLNGEAISTISTVDVTEPISITVSASRQFYAVNNKEYFYNVDNTYKPVVVTQPTDVGGSTISASPTSAQEGNTITLSYNLLGHYHFKAWNVYKTGESGTTVTVTNNQFTMPEYAVTVEAVLEEDAYATILFADGGATSGNVPTDANKYYVDDQVTMPGKNTLAKSGNTFAGWRIGGYDYVENAKYTIAEADAAIGGNEITFTAQWTPYPWGGNGKWELVTDASTLAANDYIIIASDSEEKALGAQSSNVRAGEGIERNEDKSNITNIGNATVLQLAAGNVDNSFAFLDVVENNYLAATTGTSNYITTSTTITNDASWAISMEEGNDNIAVVQAQGTGSKNLLRSNTQSHVFSCYGSNTSVAKLMLYKFVAGSYFNINYVVGEVDEPEEVSNMPATQVTANDGTATLSSEVPVYVGKLFQNWKDKDADQTYEPGANVALEQNITLTAQWGEAPKYALSYDLNGGTVKEGSAAVPDPAEYYPYQEAMVASSLLEKENVIFLGWEYDGTVYAPGASFTMPNEAATLKAKFAKGAIYTVATAASVTAQGVPEGSTATFANTFTSNKEQITKNNSMTLTLSEYKGYLIKNITLSMHSNGSDGAGTFSATVGSQSVASIATATTFNKWYDNTTYGTGYRDVHVAMTSYPAVGATDDIVITIAATTNSLYCQSFTIEYAVAPIEINDEESVDASEILPGADITINNGGELVIDVEKELNNIIVNEGAKVTVSQPLAANDVTVKDGATVTVNESMQANDLTVEAGATINVNESMEANDMIISSENGKSGQVAGTVMPTVNRDIYLEVTLDESGTMDPEKYYCISAPFSVSMADGFFWGDGTPMGLNVDFQLFEYQGSKRANTGNGWQRVSGTMKANTAYFIGFDDGNSNNQNVIKLKAANKNISDGSYTTLVAHTATGGTEQENIKNSNWNGLGNPTLHYVNLNKTVSVFEPSLQGYNPHPWSEHTLDGNNGFVVGTAFFVQGTGDLSFNNEAAGEYRAPKRESEKNYSYCVEIAKENARRYDNRLYVTASEMASSSFEEEKDLPTLNGETSKYGALLWTKNYGMRLAIEDAPIVNSSASYDLGIYAPANGTYIIRVAEAKDNADLYLTQEGAIIWNLSMGAYEIDLTKGTTNGYGLLLVEKAPGIATGVDEISGEKAGVQKIVIEDKVFILRGGKMYDVTGKAVR